MNNWLYWRDSLTCWALLKTSTKLNSTQKNTNALMPLSQRKARESRSVWT